jgi:hypothetical protein
MSLHRNSTKYEGSWRKSLEYDHCECIGSLLICALVRLDARCSESEYEDWRRLFANSTR